MKGGGEHEIVLTADGSHSVHSTRFAVDYHSTHGAIQESEHVFINAGFLPLLAQEPQEINILEMGFGTGLNALLVQLQADRFPEVKVRYHALEQYPLAQDDIVELNYPELLKIPSGKFHHLHTSKWEELVELEPNFWLEKRTGDFLSGLPAWPSAYMDLLFYDAFAPSSQPELWSPAAIDICFEALKPGGVLVTYCAKGQFKRDLKAAGFRVEPLPGPPGKREMTRAIRE